MNVFEKSALLAISLTLSTPAFAVLATRNFVIKGTYHSAVGNMEYRVTLPDPIDACPAGFAYVSETDDGGKLKIANLMMAAAGGKTVQLALQPGGQQGFCNIIEVNIQY